MLKRELAFKIVTLGRQDCTTPASGEDNVVSSVIRLQGLWLSMRGFVIWSSGR